MSIYSNIICPRLHKKCQTAYKQKCRCALCKVVKYILDWEYKEKNKETLKLKQKNYYLNNKTVYLKKSKNYQRKNKNKLKSYNKNYRIQNKKKIAIKQKEYYIKNKKSILKRQIEKENVRRKTDPLFDLKKRISHRTRNAFKNRGWNKGSSKDLLGTDFKTLKVYFEKQFLKNMSWENRNMWHIDHIIPLSNAKTKEELLKLCHYTNLQPLWARDNLTKSNKLI
jgi:hypothetical protein